jgi:hypothetical protein
MKLLHNFNKAAISLVVLSTGILGTGSALAAGTGQINGGDIYRVKDLTQNTAFANPASANACDTLQYRVRIFNPGPGDLSNVMAEVSLSNEVGTTNTSTVQFMSTNADPVSTSAQATVNLTSAQSIGYVKGSAQLLDSDTNFVKSLPDSIMQMQSGINIGNLTESQLEFIQFQAKVNCPVTPPQTPVYSCNAFNIVAGDNRTVKVSAFSTTATNGAVFKNAVVDWGDKSAQLTNANIVGQTHQFATSAGNGPFLVAATAHFTVNGQDVTAGGLQCEKQVTFTPNTPPSVTPPANTPPATPAAPTALVNTGPGSVAGLFAVATAAGTVLYRRMLTRRLSRQ